MPPRDTSLKMEELQRRLLRSMTGGQRLLLGMEMSLFSREFTKAGIRRDHPDWTERQVNLEALRLAFLPQPLPDWVR